MGTMGDKSGVVPLFVGIVKAALASQRPHLRVTAHDSRHQDGLSAGIGKNADDTAHDFTAPQTVQMMVLWSVRI